MPPSVAACPRSVSDLGVATNLGRTLGRITGLPERVDVACFPELGLTGFIPDTRVAEPPTRARGRTV